MNRNVTIIGGGNGARTASVEIALLGHKVTLYEIETFSSNLLPIQQAGYIEAFGAIQGRAPVKVEFDLEQAIQDADLILIVVPTMYQLSYAKKLALLLKKGQTVAVMPGSMGSLEFYSEVQRLGGESDINVAEIAALPYATRIQTPLSVFVFGRRRFISVGILPANKSEELFPLFDDVYPGIELMRDVLEAGLNNPNPTLHCLGVLLNAGRIEKSRGDFYYYDEGLTYHVCKAVEAIDGERLAIGKALGLDILSLLDTYWKMGYGPKGNSFWEVIRGVKSLSDIKGPDRVDSRYLMEDVPIGLCIYSQLGKMLGVDVKLMESVIHLSGALLNKDFMAEGRSLKRCGIADMDKDSLLNYVQTREKAPVSC